MYFILYSCYKSIVCINGHKKSPNLKNYTAPVLKFLDPPLHTYIFILFIYIIVKSSCCPLKLISWLMKFCFTPCWQCFRHTTPVYISDIPRLFIFQAYHACLYFRKPRRVIFQAYLAGLISELLPSHTFKLFRHLKVSYNFCALIHFLKRGISPTQK